MDNFYKPIFTLIIFCAVFIPSLRFLSREGQTTQTYYTYTLRLGLQRPLERGWRGDSVGVEPVQTEFQEPSRVGSGRGGDGHWAGATGVGTVARRQYPSATKGLNRQILRFAQNDNAEGPHCKVYECFAL